MDYIKAISKVGRALGTTIERDKLLEMIVHSAVETMEAKAACLFLLDEAQGMYVPVAQKGLSKGYTHAGLKHVKTQIAELMKKGYIHYRDAATDPRSENRGQKKAEGIVSVLVVPVRVSDRFIGTLALYTAEARDFSKPEIEFLTVLAEQGGMAIEHARLIEGMRKNAQIFLDVATDVISSLDVKEILQTLTCSVAEAMGVKAVSIRLLDEADAFEGLPLQPYKFCVHVPLLKTGLPIRGGLARLAAWAYLFKNYTLKDWVAFAEVFGMPMRVGKYGASATEAEINILKTAVANLGSDAAAVIPESMIIDFVEAQKTGSVQVYKDLAEYLDNQVSKGVLGQTASSSGTLGKLGDEKLQSEVRDDIRDDDAGQLAQTLNRDLVKPFIDLNFGPQENYPELRLAAPDAEDVAALVDALDKLVPLGLKVEQSVIRDKLGLPDPDPKAAPEELLGAIPPGPPVVKEGGTAANREETALTTEFTPEQQALENLAERAISAAALALAENERLIVEAVMGSSSFEEAMQKVMELYPAMNMDRLASILEAALIGAQGFGRFTAAEESGD